MQRQTSLTARTFATTVGAKMTHVQAEQQFRVQVEQQFVSLLGCVWEWYGAKTHLGNYCMADFIADGDLISMRYFRDFGFHPPLHQVAELIVEGVQNRLPRRHRGPY